MPNRARKTLSTTLQLMMCLHNDGARTRSTLPQLLADLAVATTASALAALTVVLLVWG
jgi:hypothetical protein